MDLSGKIDEIEPLKWELVQVFEFAGFPKKENLEKGEELGIKFARLIR